MINKESEAGLDTALANERKTNEPDFKNVEM